jgi:hypothetical protein
MVARKLSILWILHCGDIMNNNIDKLISLKEEELKKYKHASKDFPLELRKRFSVHYTKMLEDQLAALRLKKENDVK